MPYNGIDPMPSRRRKKRKHHSGAHFLSLSFLGFIVVGLSVSFAIRNCSHHHEYAEVKPRNATTHAEQENTDVKENSSESAPDTMPDSVVRICMPQAMKGVSEQIIRKTSYIVSYNKDTKTPNWVAWHLTAEHTDGPFKRLGNFHEEMDVPAPRVTAGDYRSSGWSRGHMCPAGDNKWSETAMYDSFNLVNVCPQYAKLNSGLWNSIEMDCRKWARKFGDVYIVCGPIFMNGEHETIGENDIFVPEAFFKVVLCLNGTPKALGVVVRNDDVDRKNERYYNSVDQVEHITGIDFFPALPDELENSVESEVDMNLWR